MLSTYLDAIEATGGDVLAASKALGIPESSLRSRIRREGLWERVEAIRYSAKTGPSVEDEDEGLTEENGVKVGVVQPETPWSAEDVIRFYGDDPDECEILSKRGTFWGQPESPNHHLRVNWISKADLIQPADPGSWTPPPKPRKQKKTGEPRKVVICGDHHVPFHDRTLHQLFLEWLADEQPEEGDINGDLFDFATISRHRERKSHARPVNENLQEGFNLLRDYREASPNTVWRLKKGNHCARLEHLLLDNASGLHDIRAANDDVSALSFRRLLHLDELGIEYDESDWDIARTRLSRKLSTRHGPSSGKQATKNLLDKFSVSVIQGHTHRLSMLFRTEHTDEEDEPTTTRMAAEAGCMCEIKDGLGYADSPDWNQGFLVVNIWDDGDFQVSPVPYVPGRLLAPSGRRYIA